MMHRPKLGGWWRLWIVLSVVWGIAVSWRIWLDFPSLEGLAHNQRFVDHMSQEAQSVLSGKVQSRPPPEKVPSYQALHPPVILEMPNGHTFEVESTTTKEQGQLVAKEYSRVLNDELTTRRVNALALGLIFWAVPTIGFLLFGFGVLWVYRGFRGQEKHEP